jgi:hypothetical protein
MTLLLHQVPPITMQQSSRLAMLVLVLVHLVNHSLLALRVSSKLITAVTS